MDKEIPQLHLIRDQKNNESVTKIIDDLLAQDLDNVESIVIAYVTKDAFPTIMTGGGNTMHHSTLVMLLLSWLTQSFGFSKRTP